MLWIWAVAQAACPSRRGSKQGKTPLASSDRRQQWWWWWLASTCNSIPLATPTVEWLDSFLPSDLDSPLDLKGAPPVQSYDNLNSGCRFGPQLLLLFVLAARSGHRSARPLPSSFKLRRALMTGRGARTTDSAAGN